MVGTDGREKFENRSSRMPKTDLFQDKSTWNDISDKRMFYALQKKVVGPTATAPVARWI